ncbi:MAG: DinB family protein [Vicinamibacteria bacterium]|nr:DinB family protein [Vicinamibacteria bacterium]MCL4821382.1 DinB family protein [Vicinamibacteria bacterium]
MSTGVLTAAEREPLLRQYEEGPARLRAAWEVVPAEARQWRPGPGTWSAHEVVVHCADSEANAALRLRYLVTEKEPLIVGYDQEAWAREHDYHAHPAEVALAVVDAVRAHTAALARRLPEAVWARAGRHTESGPYSACDWLRSYAAHVENHARQIERNVAAWRESRG